ncbi:MAG TPA: response regulator [Kofleriaceae bacterium]|nr:response regulator [Kofleriaceae bacterium]
MPARQPLRALIVEDSRDDADLLVMELSRAGYEVSFERVQSRTAMEAALARGPWDVVLCDYSLPGFDALGALELVNRSGLDLPFLIISGTVGEEIAVEALRAGAHDYLLKDRLGRLRPAIERERREVGLRAEQRAAAEKLRVSEERFRTLVDSMDDLVFTLDRELRYDGVFGTWLKREGIAPEQLLGRPWTEIIGEGTGEHNTAGLRALAGERVTFEWTMDGVDGLRHFLTSLSPRRGSNGEVTGLVGISREVTEQKRVQAQLLVADRMFSVGLLAAGVGHEINNPLAAVMANLDLANHHLGALAAAGPPGQPVRELEEALREARTGAERVRNIVRDLRMFSRGGDEGRQLVDAERVMDSAVRMAWNEIRHRARLIKEYGGVPRVNASESRLAQVFLNLVVNAAQALPEGQATRNEIRVATHVRGDRVVVEVADTGPGIPPEAMGRLFTPFYTTKPVGVGTGLGLSICHRIVTGLGGEITVDTEVGRGTTFRVILPSAAAEAEETATAAEPAGPAPPEPASTAPAAGRVLVVDDESMIGLAIHRMLSAHYDVTVVTRARDALDRIHGGARFDVILCDLLMPEMTGMDLHDELVLAAPDQAEAMIFVTGGAFTPRAREFLAEMASRCIEKPFDTAALRTVVADRIRRRATAGPAPAA